MFESEPLAEKLKRIRLGKTKPISFQYKGKEFYGRQLDWAEKVQVEAEVKGQLAIPKIDLRDGDTWLYYMLSYLNKALFTKVDEAGAADWINLALDDKDGVTYLSGLFNTYQDHVMPDEASVKKPPDPETQEEKKTPETENAGTE